MITYWLKNRLFFSTIFTLLSSFIIIGLFIHPTINSYSNEEYERNFAKYSHVDFDIPSPSFIQIPELKNLDHISNVIPYYFLNRDVTFNSTSLSNLGVLFFESFNQLNETMYNPSRVINSSELEFDNPILIDHSFSKKYGLKIGDTLSITFDGTLVSFQIKTIYEDNLYYQDSILVGQWNGGQKLLIENQLGRPLNYSGAYVFSNDKILTKSYLSIDYKPYGRLRDASEFPSQEAYEIHYNAFFNSNYANEISDFNLVRERTFEKANEYRTSGNFNLITASVMIFIISFIQNFSLTLRKSELKYFKNKTLSGAHYDSYYFIDGLYQSFIHMTLLIIIAIIYTLTSTIFIKLNTIIIFTSILLISKLISLFSSFFISKFIIDHLK